MPIFKMTAEVPSVWVDVVHYVNAESEEDAIRIVRAIGDEPHLFHNQEDFNGDRLINTWECESMSDEEMEEEYEDMFEEYECQVKADLNKIHNPTKENR